MQFTISKLVACFAHPYHRPASYIPAKAGSPNVVWVRNGLLIFPFTCRLERASEEDLSARGEGRICLVAVAGHLLAARTDDTEGTKDRSHLEAVHSSKLNWFTVRGTRCGFRG